MARMAKLYYRLTKPGIVYSNVMTTVAGYLFAGRFRGSIAELAVVMFGTGMIIASACVFNNYIDRSIDAKMTRTRRRALVTHEIAVRDALLFGALLGIIGFALLWLTNVMTVLVGVGAFVSYVVLYGVAKRRSVHGTLVGTLPGAAPLLAGYTAVSGRLDMTALLLFLVMLAWQMAHFYAIAIYRREDYAAAGLPVRSVRKGVRNTNVHIVVYMLAYLVVVSALTITHREGYLFALVSIVLGARWLNIAATGLMRPEADEALWARQTFFWSLIVLLGFSLMLPLGALLP